MNNAQMTARFLAAVLIGVMTLTACAQTESGESDSNSPYSKSRTFLFSEGDENSPDSAEQISTYIRRIYQDTNGNLWFATNSLGVCKFDGRTFEYYSTDEGLPKSQVTGIVEDEQGVLWFSTTGGLASFDGTSITSYTSADHPAVDRLWSISLDSSGVMWIGGEHGLSRFEHGEFTQFPIPQPAEDDPTRRMWRVADITCDRNGNLWIATNGGGVYVYDVSSDTILSHITDSEGLQGNSMTCIFEASNGDLWFGTRYSGISRYDGETFTQYTKDKIVEGDSVWDIIEDSHGNIWFTSFGNGVYRYDGERFTLFDEKQGLDNWAVQSIVEDNQSRLLFGTGAGLFRYDGDTIFNVSKNGPW